ncbi:hypothetical protein Micbo1qcDRAFT_167850, partial [Microdochium bolleyi]
MDRVWQAVSAMGRKPAVSIGAASTRISSSQPKLPGVFESQHRVAANGSDSPFPSEKFTAEDAEVEDAASVAPPKSRLNRYLDKVVHWSSSSLVFLLTTTSILAWALVGIEFADAPPWAICMSNVQAIVCYVYASLLIRQQLNGYEHDTRAVAILQSRLVSHSRMVKEALRSGRVNKPTTADEIEQIRARASALALTAATAEVAADSDKHWVARLAAGTHYCISRLADAISWFLGHIATVFGFVVCIFVWLGFGPYCSWSDQWQLYINSATSALLLLVFVVLANIRDRDASRTAQTFVALARTDVALESRLRDITGDALRNPVVTIPAPVVSRGQRAIFYYADLVGTLTGIVIMLLATAAWLASGPALGFSSNWWLLIGTYAGLMGMHDGFVLENMQTRLQSYVDRAAAEVHEGDEALLRDLGMLLPTEDGAAAAAGDVEA